MFRSDLVVTNNPIAIAAIVIIPRKNFAGTLYHVLSLVYPRNDPFHGLKSPFVSNGVEDLLQFPL